MARSEFFAGAYHLVRSAKGPLIVGGAIHVPSRYS